MTSETLMYIMTAALVVAAVAILVQTVLLFSMYLASKAMKEQVSSLIAKADPLIANSQYVIEQVRRQTTEVAEKANDILDLGRTQLVRVDDILTDAVSRTRVQMDRIELVLDDTVNRYQDTVTLLQRGIVGPIRHITGVVAAVGTIFGSLFAGRRTSPEQVTHDEEMFI